MSTGSRRKQFIVAALIASIVALVVLAAVCLVLKSDHSIGDLVVESSRGSTYTIPDTEDPSIGAAASPRFPPNQDFLKTTSSSPGPKNFVLIIGDGMGLGQISTASTLLRGADGGLTFERADFVGLTRPRALNNPVVDSASSGTAIATGFLTNNSMVGMLPDGRYVKNLLEAARDRNMATAVITTSYLMDATPACFTAHAASRNDYPEILRQMLDSGTDILIGGSSKIPFGGSGDPAMDSVVKHIEDQSELGFTLVRTEKELAEANGRILALFPSRNGDPSFHGPPLRVSIRKTLDLLAGSPSGFAAVIESEITDEAGHSNDIAALMEGVRELDEATRTVLDFAEERGDTLVLVFADHSTGVPAIVKSKAGQTKAKISWVSRHHTAHWLPIFAFGPGAEAFSGVFDQAQIGPTIGALSGFEGYPAIIPDP